VREDNEEVEVGPGWEGHDRVLAYGTNPLWYSTVSTFLLLMNETPAVLSILLLCLPLRARLNMSQS
jgi:hypothetical protein